MIVKLDIPGQAGEQTRYIGVLLQVDVFIFEGTPEPLDEDVVHSAAATIHTNEDVSLLQGGCKRGGRELRALIGVKDDGLLMTQCLTQSGQTEVTVQRVGQFPGQDVTAEPVHDGDQIHKATGQADVGDVGHQTWLGWVTAKPRSR